VHPPGGDLLRGVQSLVAGDLERAALVGQSECAGVRKRLKEGLHLLLELLPHTPLRRLEQHPARSDLDAVHDQQAPSLCREQHALGTRGRASRQRPQRQRARHRRTQRLQGIDAVRCEPLAFRVGEHAQRTRAEPQQQLVVDSRVVRRALRVESRERPGDRAAVRECLGASTQAVEGHDARKAHHGLLRTEIDLAKSAHDVVAGLPSTGRVDHEHRPPAAALLRGNHERAGPEVTLARERRDAHEMQILDLGEGEQSGAGRRRADHVVVRERQAVVAVWIGVDVANRVTRTRKERLIRACPRHWASHAHEAGFLQRGRDEPGRARHYRQPAEDLLVLDALGAASSYALHDEIEAVRLVRAYVVVVHRRAQRLARARTQRLESE